MPEQPVLIVNGDGVFEINTDGAIRQLVTGPVAYALDDTRGGLLFQFDRGRDREKFFGDPTPGRSTVVWWIPRGSAMPQALLVPTPGAGHSLSLYDTFATEESFAVVYLRHEGEEPGYEGNMADTLRVYDVATEIVTELYRVGWEHDLDWVTAGAGLISATEGMITGYGCRLLDATTGELVERAGFPSVADECFADTWDCPFRCALSSEAVRVAYGLQNQHDDVECAIVIADVATGAEVGRFTVPVVAGDCPADLDIAGDQVLLNRGWDERLDEPALVVDLSDPDSAPTELPIAGRAEFVTRPVDIAAPVSVTRSIANAPDYYSLIAQIPTRYSDTPLAIAFATLDHGIADAVARLTAEFGAPDQGEEEGLEGGRWIFGEASQIGWFWYDEWALYAQASPQGDLRLALYDGLVLGVSTVADLTSRWGEPLHVTDDDCLMVPRDDRCLNIVYSLGGDEIRFSWRTTATTVDSDWVLEHIWISDFWWPMMFIDNGGVAALGTIAEHCDERGCRVHSNSSHWTNHGQVTPFYSWGADCLDQGCDYVAIFIGTTPPPDVPIAAEWKVQSADAIGGLILARRLDDGYEVIGTTFAAQSEQLPILGPEQDPEAPHLFLYAGTSERETRQAWEIDLEALTITRFLCDGPTAPTADRCGSSEQSRQPSTAKP